MEDTQILKAAIEKAESNGFSIPHFSPSAKNPRRDLVMEAYTDESNLYMTVIFNHKFAQAFWGTEIIQTDLITEVVTLKLSGEVDDVQYQKLPAWQWHLQQLVLYENPLDYISKFI